MNAVFEKAAQEILQGNALLVMAGAGMGVDSGLPDFRGNEGFWRAYPRYAKMKIAFEEIANPRWFDQDPKLAWGFYGHRLSLYRQTIPHQGFALLKKWSERMNDGMFVYTSNVDGQFQRSDFEEERVVEAHGSIHHLQCMKNCGIGIFPADHVEVDIDLETMRAQNALPSCPKCGSAVRPNILMFDDWFWDDTRSQSQQSKFRQWRQRIEGRLVIIECGAGVSLPHIRRLSEDLARRYQARLIRINPRDCDVPAQQLSLPAGSLAALREIDAILDSCP